MNYFSYINLVLRQVQEKFKNGLFINIKHPYMKRALFLGLLLFGMIAQANPTEPVEKKTSYHCHHKAEYYAIRADLKDGKITLKQAQARWTKALKELNKREEAK